MRKLTLTALCTLATSPAIAGGWETGKLDTSFLYEEGNYVELSFGSLDYSVTGTTQAGVTHPMAKDQTRLSTSGKFQIGRLDVGITAFGSGAIQMDGQNPATTATYVVGNPSSNLTCDALASGLVTGTTVLEGTGQCSVSVVPNADVKLDTQAIMARYSFSDNFSVIAGIREAKLKSSTVETLAAAYTINSTSKTGMVYGIAYEIPQYALRAELVRSEAISMGLTGTATRDGLGTFDLDSTAALGVPEATTLKIQTGIAKDTLLMASAHTVKWNSSQIIVDVAGVPTIPNVIASDSLNTGSDFANTTSYSLGLGRKLSESTSASLTYSWEDGSGAAATSPFTMSNGSKTLSIGVKHTIDSLSISGGLSYTKAGDVEVTHMSSGQASGYTASYTGNSVTAFGLKVGYSF